MRIAVVGAGIVGVTTAQALHEDGHEVTVYERRSSVATEASFANAGWLAPGYVTPWAAPGMVRKVLGQWHARDAAVRLGGLPDAALTRWLWRFWRACDAASYPARRGAMLALARDSLARTRALAEALHIEHERAQGVLVLLRDEDEVKQSRAGLKVLAELGLNFHLLGAEACRRVEPALDAAAPLRAGIHLPEADVGNCRQFALQLKTALQQQGVEFKLLHHVQGLDTSVEGGVELQVSELPNDADTTLDTTRPAGALIPFVEHYDAAVVCAAQGAPALLPALRMPLQPVYGYSITLPVRHHEAHPDMGPRGGLMDERYKVAITRLGDRIRVAGSAELGGSARRLAEAPVATLYRVLQDWFPSATRHAAGQTWKGARPMLPDGPPAIGASGSPGVWVNTGHGSSGWALACGSARLLADLVAGRAPALDAEPFSPQRWSHR
jgi:D-amino-acid dehydrogenase